MRRRLAQAISIGLTIGVALPGAVRGSPGLPPIPGKVHPHLAQELAKREDSLVVWVFFADKGNRPFKTEAVQVTERAARRRAKVGYAEGEGELPLYRPYVDAVREISREIRARSRWLNGVSVVTGREGIERLAALPFVIRIQAVARRAPRPEPESVPRSDRPTGRKAAGDSIDYGLSIDQLEQINIPPLRNIGFSGAGVHILMLDSGFFTGAPAFVSTQIAARWDFVHDDPVVENEPDEIGRDENPERHGSQTLSMIGGYDPGWVVGPAYNATYYLAKTEDIFTEYPQEEDFWAEAIEWGESLGIDIASSSLGYIDWYTYEDMDGETAPITVAACGAVRRGVVVVNSQGNEGSETWNYMVAPADGDGVIAVGAVTIGGNRASFSSFGPTSDGRIKPDVAALGQGVAGVKFPRNDSPYASTLRGTSYSAPLVSGVCALLLEAHPSMTPDEVLRVLKETASQSAAPDTNTGWGIVDAFGAALAFGPLVHLEPLEPDDWSDGAYRPEVTIVLADRAFTAQAVFGVGETFTDTVDLVSQGNSVYTFTLPAGSPSETVRYYFRFVRDGSELTNPSDAPAHFYEVKDVTAPTVDHAPLSDLSLLEWPARVEAVVADNIALDEDSIFIEYNYYVPGSAALEQGTFPLERGPGSLFSGEFPFEGKGGGRVGYRIVAEDAAGNRASLPSEEGFYQFEITIPGYALYYNKDGEGPSNPFQEAGTKPYQIFFDLPEEQEVSVSVYDVSGRRVREVYHGVRPARAGQSVDWDGKNGSGDTPAPGIYFLRFEAGPFHETRKIVLIR